MSVSPPDLSIEILILNVMALEGRAFGRSLGYEGGALINDFSALIRDPREIPQPFHHVRTR